MQKNREKTEEINDKLRVFIRKMLPRNRQKI